jgi:hypothetical protein
MCFNCDTLTLDTYLPLDAVYSILDAGSGGLVHRRPCEVCWSEDGLEVMQLVMGRTNKVESKDYSTTQFLIATAVSNVTYPKCQKAG